MRQISDTFDAQIYVDILVHQLFETTPKSPDIPPIENLWGLAKVRVASDGVYADQQLWLSICEAWNHTRESIIQQI
jgi:hypothetical protein